MIPSNPSNKRHLVILVADHGTHLVTRSQAKRIAAMIDNYDEVELDFSEVESIGQGFADELLRVWPLAHPEMRVAVTGANQVVKMMTEHVWSRADLPQPSYTALGRRIV